METLLGLIALLAFGVFIAWRIMREKPESGSGTGGSSSRDRNEKLP